ncbi:M-phase inducer phosphatase [Tribolium castaneum]|uniref:protein-tyrosine-phosphatase n=1 Tax=Tribolium castaneum TaxID=7070 RepID=D7EJP9_TRICA|nr:PREDICTED: M-phase inducer phosphatase [Tribolium castaneum]EFA12824.1 twine [Tribolium castaneum]|eukprot:XP_969518.1 PREDICTED: M-phase inducer phosphatase [Tribolium castaneum]
MWDSISTDSCDVCQCPPRSKRGDDSCLDKENIQQALSPVKIEELSFYGNSSPPAIICSGTSPNHCNHNIITRRPLEDHDPNSRDSGYVANYNEGKFSTYASPTRGSFELASIGSMEDEFFEDFSDIEPLEDNLPQDFGKLITGPINFQNRKETPTSPRDLVIRPLFRRALSLQTERTPPSRVRSCLFKTTESRPFKRPEPPQGFESPNSKKQKIEDEEAAVPVARPVLQRCVSATEESIKFAVQRSFVEPDLIGDFSKTFCLPLTQGRHQDLKCITADTLAKLIRGDFSGNVASYKVIDCRYPYEYKGGHIDGAINVYTKEQCMELLTNVASASKEPRKRSNILVFHCEFSSKRGPDLYRYLREQDRQLNQDVYPSLHYPEVYLLEGGYKKFFEEYSDLCVPIAYTEMLHPEYENELRHFRLKSKTWNADTRQRSGCRHNLKRLGL